MTASEAILNYAVRQGGIFYRKDLLLDISLQQMGIKDSAINLQVNRMIASTPNGLFYGRQVMDIR